MTNVVCTLFLAAVFMASQETLFLAVVVFMTSQETLLTQMVGVTCFV
jgi:hypothetical protein